MKTRETFPGKTYAVTSPNGCTVTTEDGLTLAEIEAGKQGYFVAVSGKVLLSDEAAVLTQLFKLAPQQQLAILGVLGGGVPAWFKALKTELTALLDGSKFELAWLAGEKKLVVHTDRVSDVLLAAVKATAEATMPATATLEQYNHNMEISWRDINKYAKCVSTAQMRAVNAEYEEDVTSDGEWIYPLDNLTNVDWYAFNISSGQKIKKIKLFAPKIHGTMRFCYGLKSISEAYLYAPNLINAHEFFRYNSSLKKFSGFLPKVQKAIEMFDTDPLEVFDAELPALSDGTSTFGRCRLNKASALRVLNSIPAYTSGSHPLTIGIHIDHQNDEEVLAAISNAEAKGWTLTVQWNGTPTSTASTMAMGQLIYAKVSEQELPDGTTERVLDWGHYVTDPSGYEEFRSVEAAREYFGLPEEDLTNN